MLNRVQVKVRAITLVHTQEFPNIEIVVSTFIYRYRTASCYQYYLITPLHRHSATMVLTQLAYVYPPLIVLIGCCACACSGSARAHMHDYFSIQCSVCGFIPLPWFKATSSLLIGCRTCCDRLNLTALRISFACRFKSFEQIQFELTTQSVPTHSFFSLAILYTYNFYAVSQASSWSLSSLGVCYRDCASRFPVPILLRCLPAAERSANVYKENAGRDQRVTKMVRYRLRTRVSGAQVCITLIAGSVHRQS
jgi:hypothetical protein